MLQATDVPQAAAEAAQHAADQVPGKFNAGETIIGHVANSSHEHPLIHLPKVMGIDFSVTKHVLMLWLVAAIAVRRRHLAGAPLPAAGSPDRLVPSGPMSALEAIVEFVRDSIVAAQRRQEVGPHVDAAAADVLPVHPRRQRHRSDSDLRRDRRCCNHAVLHLPEDSFVVRLMHGGVDRDRQLQRHGGAGHHHLHRDHHRRQRARTGSCSTGRTWCRRGCPGRSTSS